MRGTANGNRSEYRGRRGFPYHVLRIRFKNGLRSEKKSAARLPSYRFLGLEVCAGSIPVDRSGRMEPAGMQIHVVGRLRVLMDGVPVGGASGQAQPNCRWGL